MTATPCINCGASAALDSICGECGLDPRVSEIAIDDHLRAVRTGRVSSRSASDFVTEGETASLVTAVGLLTISLGALSFATLGIALLVALSAVLAVRVNEIRTRGLLRPVTRDGERVLAGALKTAAFRLDVPVCPAYIVGSAEPNAYTSGFWGGHWIVVHSKLLELMSPAEVQFVLGHELGHIKREHVTWMVFASPRAWAPIGFVMDLLFNRWLLKAEYTADRAGLLACRRLEDAISALLKLVYWDRPFAIDQALSELSKTPDGMAGRAAELLGSHPFVLNRVRNLQRYHNLLVRQGVLPA